MIYEMDQILIADMKSSDAMILAVRERYATPEMSRQASREPEVTLKSRNLSVKTISNENQDYV